ncbi:DUF2946 family protein [Celeribacter halophilus]|uniref:DUF2946 family protein n=1 Tax=Celeribacter halophilus TaxID=576117 RepID=UPI002FD76551
MRESRYKIAMLGRSIRIFLLLGVMLGIVGPKSSALMAQLGLINARTIVICTGDGLQTITLDANGNPVEHQETRSQPCPLCNVTPALAGAAFAEPVLALYDLADYPKPADVSGRDAPYTLSFPRAPPQV